MTIGVVIICDIRIYREGIMQALGREAGINVVAAVADEREALAQLGGHLPDVVLLDMAMTGALRILERIHKATPAVKVLALTVTETRSDVNACAEAGVAEVLTREASMADLIASIYAALRGELHCSPRVGALLLERVAALAARTQKKTPIETLTRRQLQVLTLLEAGHSNKEIAHTLSIEVATVKNHVHHILECLHVSNRGEAAALYRRDTSVKL